jgi:iron complex outermembrane receptor protein
MLMKTRPVSTRVFSLKPTSLALALAGIHGASALLLALNSGTAMAQTSPSTAAVTEENMSAVIVTGTRRGGLKAVDSASPIQVLDATALEKTGQPNLIQAMAQNLPSFNAQATGSDTSRMTLSARLRSLSPNDTLVLINGKRRHTTANLSIGLGPYQGGAPTDLDYIPVAAIDHIEVLQDGAAAQYGTDAIAGVVNIILKKDASGGSISATGGRYGDGGGNTGAISFNLGLEPNDKSFINLTGEQKYHGHSFRGRADPRVAANLATQPGLLGAEYYPLVNRTAGDASYHQSILMLNTGYDLGDGTELYGNASYGKKDADSLQNYRMPSIAPTYYPNGFTPSQQMQETDYGYSVGAKGRMLDDWNWDLSTTYGKDDIGINVINSISTALIAATGSSPINFYNGGFRASQWTSNLDLTHDYNIGWASPLTLAVGLEYRKDSYGIEAGEASARVGSGPQSYGAFQLTDAGYHSRNNKSAYINFAGNPIKELKLDVAARYETYSDFGSARVGKITGRYDFSPTVALRSTVSNGFRAPTMAEQYYSATNVSPSSAIVQLAPGSAGAAVLGINGLKPEKSQNYSLGMVFKPTQGMSLAVDAYVINIHDRIVGSDTLYATGANTSSVAVRNAILANGNVLDSTVSQTGIAIFNNGVNTRNKGVEAVWSYSSNYGNLGRVDWGISGNYNKTEVTQIKDAPAALQGRVLIGQLAIAALETSSPKYRLNLGGTWKRGDWTVNLRESVYGKSSNYAQQTVSGVVYTFENVVKTAFLTDLEVGYRWSKQLSFALGANNLFNKYPNENNPELLAAQVRAANQAGASRYPAISPFGINGGYYYGRVTYAF